MSELGVGQEAQQSQPAAPANGMGVPSSPQVSTGVEGPEPPDLNGLLPHMEGGHQREATKYEKLKEAQGKATTMREQLDSLVKLGDMISSEDLVKAASKLVAKGFGAGELAGILSEAPDAGEALQGWVMQKDLSLRQNEQKLTAMLDQTRHDLGVSAMRLLAGHSMAQAHGWGAEPQSTLSPPSSGAAQATGAANSLIPGGSDA